MPSDDRIYPRPDESVEEILRHRQPLEIIVLSSGESSDESIAPVEVRPIRQTQGRNTAIRVFRGRVFARGRRRADVPPRFESDSSSDESRAEQDILED